MSYVAVLAGKLDIFVDPGKDLNILFRWAQPAAAPTTAVEVVISAGLREHVLAQGTGVTVQTGTVRMQLAKNVIATLTDRGTWVMRANGENLIRGEWQVTNVGTGGAQDEVIVTIGEQEVTVIVSMSSELAGHNADTTNVHGIADTQELETQDGAQLKADLAQEQAEGTAAQLIAQHASAANPHPDYDTAAEVDAKITQTVTSLQAFAAGRLADHASATTNVHGIADTAQLETLSGAQAKANAAQQAAVAALNQHINDPDGAHNAEAITFVATPDIQATNVQAAIEAVRSAAPDISDHTGDQVGAHAASAVSFAPAGGISATTVQAAITEVSGDVSTLGVTVGQHTDSITSHGTQLATHSNALTNLTQDVTELQDAVSNIAEGSELDEVAADLAVIRDDLTTHTLQTTNVHGIASTANLETQAGATTKANAARAAAEATAATALAAHVNDTTAAHAASAISFTPQSTIAATDVQAAIAEVAADAATALATHAASAATDAEVAAAITAHKQEVDPHPQYATSAEVTVLINDTIGAESGTLEALQAIADLLADDPDALTALTTELATKQPLDSDLTAIAALTTTSFGRDFLALADAAAARAKMSVLSTSEVDAQISALQATLTGVQTNVSNLSTSLGTTNANLADLDDAVDIQINDAIATRQPLDSDLTAIAALTTTSFGRSLLTLVDAAAARTALGLGSAATTAATAYDAVGTGAAQAAAAQAFAIQRGNHTGTQLASTISDFDTAVRLNRLNQLAAPTATVSLNGNRIVNVGDPTAGQDAATRAWVLAQLTSIVGGAPTGLDTLVEIASSINNDTNFAGTMAAQLAAINATLTTLNTTVAGKQPLDSDLTAIAGLSTTTFGRSLLVTADAAALRTALGSVITAAEAAAAYQPLDADLSAIAALTTTPTGRSLLAIADAAAGRTVLGAAATADVTAASNAAAAALAAHNAATTNVHGIANTALLETQAGAQAKIDAALAGFNPGAAGVAATIDMASHTGPIDLSGKSYVTILMRGGTYDFSFTWPTGLHDVEVELVDVAGGSVVSFTGITRWAGAIAPIVSDGAGDRTVVGFVSPDGGTNVTGYSGQRLTTWQWYWDVGALNAIAHPFITNRRTQLVNLRVLAGTAGAGGGPMVLDVEANGTSLWAGALAQRPSLNAGAQSGVNVNTFTTSRLSPGTLLIPKIAAIYGTTQATKIALQMRYYEV